ncbi:MAG: amino acid adenylation domain-containing protein [Hungatella sp.]|jgi:amino acid adenylation domain-containing protein/thioester reductase-like protein|nr:amino acid adenylation domain-containing protein [Hungatella sp.]
MNCEENSKKQQLFNTILKGKIKGRQEKPWGTIHRTGHKRAPLSYAQSRMWFLHQLSQEEEDAYHMHSVLKLRGELDNEALIYSLLKIVEKHEILRTNFLVNESGEPVQEVREDFDRTIPVKDMSGCEETAISQYISEELAKPFDLEKDMLIRAILLKQSETFHYLVVVMHHIVSDGWSFGILSRELMLYYNRYLEHDNRVEPLTVQYIDYTYWQQQYLLSGRMEHQCEYWKKQLENLPDPLELKIRKRSASENSSAAGKYVFSLESGRLNVIKELCKESGTTLYMVLLGVYGVLLNKYSFQEDFIIGTPIANRRRKELEDVIGFFVNTLPIRIRMNPDIEFQEFLQEVKKVTITAFSNQDIPFEYIVREVIGERYGESVPVIQTMFVLQNTQNVKVTLPNLTVETELSENTIAKFDLLFTAAETEQGLYLCFEYKKDMFDSDLISSIADKYLHILDDILKDSHKRVSELAIDEEVIVNKDILFDSVVEFHAKTIVERFYEVAGKNADKIAVYWNGETVSYKELNRRSNQLSRYMERFLSEKESFIGLCMERSIDMIVGILAILKAQCAYVPLDPDSPEERLDFIIRDAGLKMLIGQKETLEKIHISEDIPVIDIQESQEMIMQEADINKTVERLSHSNAYMIYTSGSTGNPKGVIVSDYNVLRLFSHTDNLYHFNNKDVWTMFHSVAFDFSVWEIWGALLYGGELVVVPYKMSRTPEAFMKLLIDRKVTVLNQTPSAFCQLLQCDGIYNKETIEKMKLRYIIFGGEALDFGMLKQWFDAYGDKSPQLINMYGITETTVHVTYEVLSREKIKNINQSLIGIPIKDLKIYILDHRLRQVPDHVIGEMYVGGAGVSKGYWNREKLNRERFIQNPFISEMDILYKTGDLACRHTGGDLEYIGRNDEQVKVKGFRIELNEIREQINRNSLVKDNVVILDKIDHDARIISYLLLEKEARKNIVQELLDKDDYDVETEEVFDHNYRQSNTLENDMFNIIGWNNSYDNGQMSEKEMKEWLDSICSKLSEIPMHTVLEIGIGTGMILHRIAPLAECYVGLDISKEAVEYNKRVIEKNHLSYNNVKLIHASVEDLQDEVSTSFDTVIINSVAQYFPDVSYFEKALHACIERIGEKGHIIIGDVRSYDRLGMYYLSVELFRLDKAMSVYALKKNIDIRKENEKELIFSHNYFKELQDRIPEIACVDITPKKGNIDNELSKYRYDVILSVDKRNKNTADPGIEVKFEKVDWQQAGLSFSSIKAGIKQYAGELFHVRNIPDDRVGLEALFLQNLNNVGEETTIESYKKLLEYQKKQGLSYGEIKELTDLARGRGYRIHIDMDNIPGCLDMIVYRSCIEKKAVLQYVNYYYSYDMNEEKTTEPLKYKVQYKAVEKLKDFLKDRLPYYMIPNEFLLLERLPLTINGKIDYEALPKLQLFNKVSVKEGGWQSDHVIQEITKVWKNLLHVEEILPEDNFFQLGGHSLLATNLIFSLNDIFGVRIPLKYLFEEPTIIGISRYLQKELNTDSPLAEKVLRLEEDVRLPEKFEFCGVKDFPFDKVLVTGATGFFGAFLVRRLLEETSAVLYCLVRADDGVHARKRLMETLRNYKLYDDSYETRIIAVCGDLSKPYFGMKLDDYQDYAKDIDTVVHNGAKVNFFEPYESLKDTNVNGTLEILQFASAHTTKPVHFISTLYVHEPSPNKDEECIVDEEKPLLSYKQLKMGYTQSKWVAENILELARKKGFPINIYRLGRISGHSKTGACQQSDFLWSLVKGCIEIGVYPDQDLEFEFMPVDYLTDAVVKIIKSEELNKNYHLFNRQKTALKDIVHSMSENYKIKAVDKNIWLESITSKVNSARHLSQLLADDTFEGGYMHFKNDHAVKQVPYYREGIKVSNKMLKALNKYFIEVGYFPLETAGKCVTHG